MKSFKLYLLALATLLSYASCSDDHTDNAAPEVPTSALIVNRLGGYYDFEQKSQGRWTVAAPEECDWLTVLTTEGESSGKVSLYITDNSMLQNREVKLILTNKNSGESNTYTIRQTPLFDGEEENSDVDFLDAFKDKGIGKGFDITTGKTKQSVIQMTGLKNLIKPDGIFEDADLYSESNLSIVNAKTVCYDSLVGKNDTLGISLSIDLSFGKFKLNVKGAYHSAERLDHTNVSYNLGYTIPAYEAELAYADLLSNYDELNDTKIKEQLISKSFGQLREEITNYAQNNETKKLKEALELLNERYGAVVVTKSQLGGQLQMRFDSDSTMIADTMRISGNVTAGIDLGFFKLDVNVAAGYFKAGKDLLEKSNLSMNLVGGDRMAGEQMVKYLVASHDLNQGILHGHLEKWMGSITINPSDKKKNTAEVVNVEMTPIWNFFKKETMPHVRQFMQDYYAEKKTIVDLKQFR